MAKDKLMTSESSYIYIDIAGAQRDRAEIDKAIREIDEALKIINPAIIDVSVFQGVTYDQVSEELKNMRRNLEDERRKCEELKNRIMSIVDYFVKLDREIKQRIAEVMGHG